MRRPFTSRLTIWVSDARITLTRVRGLFRPTVAWQTAIPTGGASASEVLVNLAQLLGEHACQHLVTQVILPDSWFRMMVIQPPDNAGSLSDCSAAVHARFQALYGEPVTGWDLRADWHATQAFLVCALPSALVSTLAEIGSVHGLALISIQPSFVQAWNRWYMRLQHNAWLMQVQDGRLTWGVHEQGRWVGVRSVVMGPEGHASRAWLEAHVTREALRLNVSVPENVLLCGEVPPVWLCQDGGTLRCVGLENRGGGA